MSIEAITWALKQPIEKSSAKFVLVVMANCVNGEECGDQFLSWPSVAFIEQATGQNRKTVLESIKRLREWGYLVDTGERRGGTGSVPVYLLSSPKTGTASCVKAVSEKDPVGAQEQSQIYAEVVPISVPVEEPEAVPNLDGSSTEFGRKQSQKRNEAVPKTVPGTGRTGKEQEGKRKLKVQTAFSLPGWISFEAWSGYVEMRKRIRKPMTDYAMTLAVKDLEALRDAGHDVDAVLNQSTMKSWQGLFEVKARGVAKPGMDRHGNFGNQDYRAGVAADGSF